METIKTNNIRPLTDFKNNMKAYIKELNSNKQPIVLTQRGKSAAVLLDAEKFQEMQDQIEFMRKIALGLEDYKQGRLHSISDTFAELDDIIKLPDNR